MKIAVMLCALLSTVAMAGSVPVGSGGGVGTNTDRLNGIWENGQNMNGVWQNGLGLNAIGLNGINLNGTWLNGTRSQGIQLNTLQLRPVTYQGLRWDPSTPSETGLKVENASARNGKLFIRGK